MQPFEEQMEHVVDMALAEDVGHGDITSRLLIPPQIQGKACLVARAAGVVAGGKVAQKVFLRVAPALIVELLIADGAKVEPGAVIATVRGNVASILMAERVALNFLSLLSGIATVTARYVAQAGGSTVIIKDTRKTLPGLRLLEKYAVRVGGGQNHRSHLGDGILIKDNHLAALDALGMSLKDVVVQAKRQAPPGMLVEVEVNSAAQALAAAAAGADIIMLDNMSPEAMSQVRGQIPRRIKLEASGGITLDNIRRVAVTGVDFISVGALTHSPLALDISLDLEPTELSQS